MDAKGGIRRRSIKEPSQNLNVCGIVDGVDGIRGTSPVYPSLVDNEQKSEVVESVPRLRCRWIKALAKRLWPVLSIQPQPESLVQPFSPMLHGQARGLAVAGLFRSACGSGSMSLGSGPQARSASLPSLMGGK
jgi:hypothetical protein